MVLNFSNFEIMNNKELVSILVRQLCDMDDHGNGWQKILCTIL